MENIWLEKNLVQLILSLVQFGFTQAKFQENQNVSTKAMWELSFCSLVRNHVGHIPSPSAVCSTFWTFHVLYFFFLAVGLSAQKSRGQCISPTSQVNPPVMFMSQQTASCLQSRTQPIMHMAAGYGSWHSPKMHNCFQAWAAWDQIMFILQMNCTRVCLKLDRDHLLKQTYRQRSGCFGPHPSSIRPSSTHRTKA